jgi:molybdopterin-guanine dinucleotide biosynthesis protein A
MGYDKAWAVLDGKPLVVRVIDALQRFCNETIVVANNPTGYDRVDARVVGDEIANAGSLGGLYSGLKAARNELAVAVACDMPFLNPELLQFLITLSFDYDVIVPTVRDERKPTPEAKGVDNAKRRNLHPLHAVYRKTCLAPMCEAIERDDLRMISFHNAVRVRIVEQAEIETFDPRHLSFWNVNTQEELRRAEQALS